MVSIVIVNYRVKGELLKCIKSIFASKPKANFEIIVVDNDELKTLKQILLKKFPKVQYIPNDNKGFGQANNIGAKHAKGDFLYFLNPDTECINNAIDSLIKYLNENKNYAIVAPLLLDKDKKPYQQGSLSLNITRAIFALSFINKILPNNQISKKYFLHSWDFKSIKEVDVVPGTAFMIRKYIFDQLGGFDENFFLYFEEFDLCNRVKKIGYKIAINPSSKFIHYWGESTKKRSDINAIFKKSRFYYFKKNFGLQKAIFVEIFLGLNKYHFMFFPVLILGLFLRFSSLGQTPFIGDHAWFYLSARDMLVQGVIPLVGIPSSHPWLHQGAFWTYLLAIPFYISNFNPVSGAYLSSLIDIIALISIYIVGSQMFSKKVGIISAVIYATSPLIVLNARIPYHTSPIPLFTIFYIYFLYKWIKGGKFYFPATILILMILYNFQISTFLLSAAFMLVIFYGYFKKTTWFKNILNKKIFLISILSLILPLLPMLIYDIHHQFPQTLRFVAWLGYRVLLVFGYPPINPSTSDINFGYFLIFSVEHYQRFIFPISATISYLVGFFSIIYYYASNILKIKRRIFNANHILLLHIFTISLAGYLFARVPSQAYLPIFFPTITLITAIFFSKLLENNFLKNISIFSIIIILTMNSYYLISRNFTFSDYHYGSTIEEKTYNARDIIRLAGDEEYNLIGEGPNSEFDSFTMDYEYLTWWLGHGPTKTPRSLKIVIREDDGKTTVKKQIIK